jgi:CBS domain containing-hemolysin-like protein
MAAVLDPFLKAYIPYFETHKLGLLFLQTVISTLIVLFTAEFIPKVLFRINPDLILQVLAIPFLLFYYLFWPIVHVIIWLSKIILNAFFKIRYTETNPVFTKIDLDDYINQVSDNDLDDDADVDTEMFKNALDFSNLKVRDCMTPRTDLELIDITDTPDELYNKFEK